MPSRSRVLGVLLFLVLFSAGVAAQPEPSHPLSQIDPTDSELNMSNNAGLTPYAIVGVPRIDPAGSSLGIGGDIDMEGNSIRNFFSAQCPAGEAVVGVNPDGTYQCSSISGSVSDVYVNEAGDTMTGVLSLDGNRIENVGAANSGDDVMRRDNIYAAFVEIAGDQMTGNLDLNGNALQNPSQLTNYYGSACPAGQVVQDVNDDGTFSCAAVDSVGDPWVNESGDTMTGALDLNGNALQNPSQISNYYGGACPAGQAVQDVNDDGTFSCVSVSTNIGDPWVNESGDTMSGTLNMGGNRIENVGAANSGDDVMRRDNIYAAFVEVAGDSMTGNLDLNGNSLLNGPVCPDGSCTSGNEYFDSSGIHTTSIYSGSGGEIDIQDQLMLNGNNLDGISTLRDQSRDTLVTFDDGGNDVVMQAGFRVPVGTDAW